MTILFAIIQTLAVLLVAPGVVGLVRKCKARLQNRRGASIVTPYWALLSLTKKEMTITAHSSWVFQCAPFVVFACALALAILVPTSAYGVVPVQLGNVFLIAGIVALGSVFLVFGGMDTASAFGNMGASREMTIASLVEPAFFVTFAAFGAVGASFSLDGIVGNIAQHGMFVPSLLLSLVGLVFIVLAENARYPLDNPATHLELTMVHEAMLIEYSGPHLALLEYASAIKLTVMLLLIMNILIPIGLLHPGISFAGMLGVVMYFFLKLVVACSVLALIESVIAKMRFYRAQEYMALSAIIAIAGCILAIAIH